MKKTILILLFSLTLFANTDSCKLDVYFGNGVWNNVEAAKFSRDKLKQFMRLHNPGRFGVTVDGSTYDFKYAHNETYGYVNDLIETHWQLYESGQIGKLYFSFITSFLDSLDNSNPDEDAFRKRLQNIIYLYNLDTAAMLDKYRKDSFNSKHNVLLVAHSQGNLFGNKMYDLLTDAEKKKFEMVSVATPASKVSKGGSYTTLHYDLLMRSIPGSLASNADGSGHTFVNSYLNNPIYESVEAIALNITNAVNLLDKNSCQKYKYFRWISYMCPIREDTELEVAIYGYKLNSVGVALPGEIVSFGARERVALEHDSCPLSHWDYITSTPNHDKNGCSAYTFDDTTRNSLDDIASKTYENGYTCTKYGMASNVTEKLRNLQ